MSGIDLGTLKLSSTVSDSDCDIGKSDKNTITGISIQLNNTTRDAEKKTFNPTNVPIVSENENDLDLPSSNRQRSSTTNSIGSNNISIVTIDENENDSSVIDSDSDADDVVNCNDNDYRSPSGIVLVDKIVDPNVCQSSILCANNDVNSNIGSIAVQNSSDITFGNKTFYQGPVTIKQFVLDKNKWKESDPPGNDNLGYVNSSTDNADKKRKGKSTYKSVNTQIYNIPVSTDSRKYSFQSVDSDFTSQSNINIKNDNLL